ncbi:MAG TPA: hypothetical protein DHV62_04995 [Elusimicrobia bacterium]|jgi:glycosyltransferase involved in cell wall biosynthesis|nr:hypothetical protein [Elusimicrobiota bacterium]
MKKIKVAHIITKLELGGAQQNTLYTVEHLPRDKYEVILISGCGGILEEEAKKIPNTKVYFLPSLIREVNPICDLRAFFAIWRILCFERPDIVHTHSSKAGILARWAAWFARYSLPATRYPKIIHTFHGFGFNLYQKWLTMKFFIFLEYITAKITDKLVAVSEENIKTGLENKIGTTEKYILIRSGIKISHFVEVRINPEEKKKELGIQPNNLVVTTIAPFKPQKDLSTFIEMAKIVIQSPSNLITKSPVFLIVGDGELRNNLQSAICNLQLEKEVILTGWRRDIPEIMRITDIFVLTGLWEGLPRTILEAMVSERPVVATAVDGNREIVKDGVTGFLVPPKEPQKMAEKVIFLLTNREIAKKMGGEGKKIIDTSFDIDQMVNQLDSLYQSFFLPAP